MDVPQKEGCDFGCCGQAEDGEEVRGDLFTREEHDAAAQIAALIEVIANPNLFVVYA